MPSLKLLRLFEIVEESRIMRIQGINEHYLSSSGNKAGTKPMTSTAGTNAVSALSSELASQLGVGHLQ